MRRTKEEHIVRRMLDVDIHWTYTLYQGKEEEGGEKRDMTEAGLKEVKATNRAAGGRS